MSFIHKLTRRGSVVAIVAALATLATAPPASAANAAGLGTVAGIVTVGSAGTYNGVPTDPNVTETTTYTFSSTSIVGAFADDGPHADAGTLSVTASGQSNNETNATATGSVTLDTCSGTVVGTDITAAATCTGSGTFTRIGDIVIVDLTISITVNGRTITVHIRVVAIFTPIPTKIDCNGPISGWPSPPLPPSPNVPHCIQQAVFAGVYAGVDTV